MLTRANNHFKVVRKYKQLIEIDNSVFHMTFLSFLHLLLLDFVASSEEMVSIFVH